MSAGLALMNVSVLAQLARTLPADAVRGTVTHLSELRVIVNGVPTELSANVRIWNTDNLFIVPQAIPPGSIVRFSLDVNRQIDRMWVLTKAEADRTDPTPPNRVPTPLPLGTFTVPAIPQAPQ